MPTFAEIYPAETTGQLTMFDRMIFKGYLSGLYPAQKQFEWYLYQQEVLLKDYKKYAEETTDALKEHLIEMGQAAGCEVQYLPNGRGPKGESKEEMARQLGQQKGNPEGLIALFSSLELKNCFTVRGNRASHQLEVKVERRKHLHYYLYYNDVEFGLMYVRIQSWWPFEIQIYINGHEWLARQMDQAGIGYVRYENCFWQIDDLEQAQALADKFAHRQWERVWNNFARRLNPFLAQIEASVKKGYYWTIEQCEIATDVMFADQATLDDMLPDLFAEALLTFSAQDVMRFLGRKLHSNFQGEVRTHLNKRQPGWRVKHWVKQNGLKMYNKGSVLRVETVINTSGEFRVPTPQENSRRWKPLPKGVAYCWHFYQTGREANQRYLEAVAPLPFKGKAASQALDSLCQSQQQHGRRIAKFQPVSDADCRLFAAVLSGDHCLTGFRNRHLRQALYQTPPRDEQQAKRHCTRVSRLIAKLRGHNLVEKVQLSHLYRVTAHGYKVMAAALRYRLVDFPTNFSAA